MPVELDLAACPEPNSLLQALLSKPFRRNLIEAEILGRDDLVARFLSHHDRLKAAALLPDSRELAAILVRLSTPLQKASMPRVLPLVADPVRLDGMAAALDRLDRIARDGDPSAGVARHALRTWQDPLGNLLAVDAEVTSRGISRLAPDGTPLSVSNAVSHWLDGRL